MRAVVLERFGGPLAVVDVPEPACPADGVVVRVAATGLCRSDWHAWVGHDADITLPHVPGHELAGTITEVGSAVRDWQVGDRVTTPFVCACGRCETCRRGDHQVCEDQRQPGFTDWGSYAERVALHRADVNLVRVPEGMGLDVAASLGCRFATAWRAVVQLGEVAAGDTVAVHGCGGVGLSAVLIAASRGAQVVAVDVSTASLERAVALGAVATVDARVVSDVPSAVRDVVPAGVDVSVDALGSPELLEASLRSLRPRGRHVQVGLLAGEHARPAVPMDLVVASELQLLGSHGMAAHAYPAMLAEIAAGRLRPELLIRDRVTLEEGAERLAALGEPGAGAGGVTIIEP